MTKTTSIPIAAIIKDRFGIETVAHITCINMRINYLLKTFDVLNYFDIKNILALRGDKPENYILKDGYLNFASSLVEEIRLYDQTFSIGIACYPEGHPECLDKNGKKDKEKDFNFFVEKAKKGADYAITQLFLDNSFYFDFVDKVKRRGINIPIIPGIMPIISLNNITMIKKLTGVSIPHSLERKIIENSEDKIEIYEIGIEHALKQCNSLMNKVPCIHFYTMDMWKPTDRIIRELLK
jgi:methylenetetrahydrofolate reductase (NADPH)